VVAKFLKEFFKKRIIVPGTDRSSFHHALCFQAQSQKPHERKAVNYLIFYSYIQKVVQVLKKKNLKHQHKIMGFAPSFLFSPWIEAFQVRGEICSIQLPCSI